MFRKTRGIVPMPPGGGVLGTPSSAQFGYLRAKRMVLPQYMHVLFQDPQAPGPFGDNPDTSPPNSVRKDGSCYIMVG